MATTNVHGVSRRSFFGAAAAVLGAGALTACAPTVQGADTATTSSDEAAYEADVVIVGSGLAGMIAALRAQELGKSVIVVDKGAMLGSFSNSAISGGALCIPRDDSEEARQLMVDVWNIKSKGKGDQALTKMIVDGTHAGIDWIKGYGAEFTEPTQIKPYDCYQMYFAPGPSKGIGPALQNLIKTYEANGGQSLTSAKMLDIVFDGRGRAAGVRVRTSNGIETVAGKAVILATGGYVANKQLLEQFVGQDGDEVMVRGNSAMTGDGHLAALRAGGMLVNMGGVDSLHMAAVDPNNPAAGNPFGAAPYTLAINSEGKRFVDESLGYVSIGKGLMAQEGQTAALIFTDTLMNTVPAVATDYQKFLDQGISVAEADSLEELAAQIGADPAGLAATIAEFNASTNGEATSGLAVDKTALATTFEGGKYYAFYPLNPGSVLGFGGLYVDDEMHVLEPDGTAIPSLYAAGEIIGGIFKYDYVAGASVVRAIVTVIAAGEQAANAR